MTRRCSTPSGIHQPFAVRSIIEVETSDGVTGLSESYGDAGHLRRLAQVGRALVGHDVFATNTMLDVTASTLGGVVGYDAHGLTGAITAAGTVLRTYAAFEVAALDIQGKMASRPVSDLLGGKVRSSVPFSAYLFYKWASHPGGEPDRFGEALGPLTIVEQARVMLEEYGFRAIKLKGGVMAPDVEIDDGPRTPRRLSRRAASPRSEHRVDRRDLDPRRERAGGRPRVPRGPHSRYRRHGPRGARSIHAARDEHVRRRVRGHRVGRGEARRSASYSPTTTSGAGWRRCTTSPPSAPPSTSDSRCTPTRTSASASPP